MARLLAGDFGPPPTILVGFNHSGQLRDDVVAARGRVAISIDTKPCARGGVHAVLDVCDVIDMAEWEEAYFNPPCQFSSRSDTTCMHSKMGDGRFWWGVAKVALCLCAPSDKVFVEQPWSHAEEAIGVAASQSIDPRDFDDRVKKTLRVWVRGGGAIRPPVGLVSTAHSAPDSELLQWRNGLPDGDDALELRSDWRLLPNVSAAVAACMGGSEPPGPRPVYAVLVEAMAERLYDLGVPIPWDYANADARPTSDQARVYSQVRGAGDGRLTEGVRPALVRAREAAGVPPSAPGSVATFPLECAGTSLKYVRPRPRSAQPRGDAASSSGISRCASRIHPPARVAGALSLQAIAPSPPPLEGRDLIGVRSTAASGGRSAAPQVRSLASRGRMPRLGSLRGPALLCPPRDHRGGARLARALSRLRVAGRGIPSMRTAHSPLTCACGMVASTAFLIAIGRLSGDPARTPGGLGYPRSVGGRASAPHSSPAFSRLSHPPAPCGACGSLPLWRRGTARSRRRPHTCHF